MHPFIQLANIESIKVMHESSSSGAINQVFVKFSYGFKTLEKQSKHTLYSQSSTVLKYRVLKNTKWMYISNSIT